MRTVRLTIPGVVYHLISRFVDKRWFFKDNDERRRFLHLLGRALGDTDWKCLAYALMSSHIHYAFVAGTTPLESWTKRVHSPFASWMNVRHARIGPVFVRGPSDYAVPPDRIAAVIAYIHNNPVRACVVEQARDSEWTSHRAYLGEVAPPAWLHVERGLGFGGFTNAADFDDWVRAAPDDPSRVEFGGLRRATPRGQIVQMTPTVGDLVTIPLFIRDTAFLRVDPRWFVQQTASVVGIDVNELCSRCRTSAVVSARRVAVHSALAFSVAVVDIGNALAISATAASMISRHILTPEQAAARDAVIERIKVLTGATIEDRPRSGQG